MDALVDGGVMKRLDLAINDHTGMLDIPELTEKCRMRNVYRCSVPLSPMLPANWSSMRKGQGWYGLYALYRLAKK